MPNNPLDDELLKELGLEPREASPPKPPPPKAPPVSSPLPRKPTPPPVVTPEARAPVTPQQQPKPSPQSSSPSGGTSQEISNLAKEMPIQVVAVLGKKTLALKEVLALKQGEILELKKLPQEMVDLVANGKLMARGELVMVDGRLGIQIKQILG